MRKDTRNQLLTGLFVLVLVGLSVWINLPNHPTIRLGQFYRDLNVKLGLDLQGGSHLVYRAIIDKEQIKDPSEALAGVRDVIERRVNYSGISEPVIQTNRIGGEYRVIVELAGVHDPKKAIAMIGETPQLDFRKEIEGGDAEGKLNVEGESGVGPLFERTKLTGQQLERATVSFDPVIGTPEVSLEFDSEGTELFAQLTKDNVGKRIAIYLDGVPISAPVVQTEITNGKAVITGGFTLDEAKQLARRLNAGALPVPIELIGQQTIGPSLGKIAIGHSIKAGWYGIAAVVIWIILYYRLPGAVAAIALAVYALLFLSIIKLLPVTLTLAGIAGFILSVGMAVDANVLIFERFRENIKKGKTIEWAMKEGFTEAWDSIKASNVSGLITGFILYGFGTSIVRGFALTLSIGIVLSMFTAITVTRLILTLILAMKVFRAPFLLGAKAPTTDS